jgi:hypothetical protein
MIQPQQISDELLNEISRSNWYPLRYHKEQSRLWLTQSRFNVVPAGRRSGKTEICGKRKLILRALKGTNFPDPKFFAAAPTRDQAKRIYWKDLKRMAPKQLLMPNGISESKMTLHFVNNAEIHVLGMDKPERVEGTPWDGGVLDEYANMKKNTWYEHVRAALSDRRGWCDFIGVPEGRNHYYDIYKDAQAQLIEAIKKGRVPEWNAFWWKSADILPADEIAAAKRDLDQLTYEQEYEASFVNFSGRAYYNFRDKTHCGKLDYNPKADLDFCFDFNVSPGVAVVLQEQWLPTSEDEETYGDGIIGEVYIPQNSNTVRVCKKLIKDWGKHEGKIFCYGDFTGGARGSAAILGSDWQLVKEKLWGHFGTDRVFFRITPNPRERDRINSVNSRLLTLTEHINCMVDPSGAPNVVKDFEGVSLIEGGTGEIDKSTNPELTHLTDAYGYRTWKKYPVKRKYVSSGQRYWK